MTRRSFPLIVSSSHTDKNGNMKLFSAVQWMQDCSVISFMGDTDFCEWLDENNATPLVNFRQLEVLRVPRLQEKLTCVSYVYDVQGAFGYRNTAIYDAQGQACYKSWLIAAYVNLATGRLSKISSEVLSKLQFQPRIEMTYGSRKIALPDAPMTPLAPIRVMRDDIDYNNHVNNAQYIRMALECLPEDFQVGGMRVEYKKTVSPGSTIIPSIAFSANTAFIVMEAAGSICCVVEFTAE